MNINHTPNMARRAFLKRSAALGISSSLTPWALQLAMMGEAAAAPADDYKALVCVFFSGGNDYANTFVPVDNTHYSQYASLRGTLATAQNNLLATALTPTTALADGLQYALAPQLAPLKQLWDEQHLAIQLNVGPLVVPTTKAQYTAKTVPLPPKLFSHNDQTSLWQSGLTEGATSGWGGRMGDLLMSLNSNSVFTCISSSGNATLLSGETVVQYQVGTSGATAISGIKNAPYGSTACMHALNALITRPTPHLFAEEYTRVTRRSIDTQALVAAGVNSVTLNTVFDSTNNLAMQLKIVARLIGARATFGAKRQVFLVSIGGFDLHDNLVANHPVLLTRVANAMRSFYDATVELGVAQNVTTFTASDFGRTFTTNGDGSDHGWGSHHLVMGGAVNGKQFYGTAPTMVVRGPDDIGNGQLLPTTSVDQYAATFASWMGVAASDMEWVMPNIGNFSSPNLGFV
jgi:uncharacterized protein (DUF1501 family)